MNELRLLPSALNTKRRNAKFALLSVSDKTGIAEFAQALVSQFEYTILSTGGTAKLLRDREFP